MDPSPSRCSFHRTAARRRVATTLQVRVRHSPASRNRSASPMGVISVSAGVGDGRADPQHRRLTGVSLAGDVKWGQSGGVLPFGPRDQQNRGFHKGNSNAEIWIQVCVLCLCLCAYVCVRTRPALLLGCFKVWCFGTLSMTCMRVRAPELVAHGLSCSFRSKTGRHLSTRSRPLTTR